MTDLRTGKWRPIGKAEFARTIGMYAAGDRLVKIEQDGTLYWMEVK